MAFDLSMKHTVYWGYHLITYWRKRRFSKSHIGMLNRFRMLMQGFERDSYVRYELSENNSKDYVSDYERWVRTPMINHDYRILLNDKHVFHSFFSQFENLTPILYGVVRNGSFLSHDSQSGCLEVEDLFEKCRKTGGLVIKPTQGCCGRSILIIKWDDNQFYLNGEPVDKPEIVSQIQQQKYSLVTEYIQQSDFAKQIYPNTTNTVRILTMFDPSQKKAFAAAIVMRIGTQTSGAVDNFSQGGLSVSVCLESGRLGKAARYCRGNKLKRLTHHPDTNAPIEGAMIPNWDNVLSRVLEVADQLPYLPYIGWDVILTNDGIKIIEGNTDSDLDLFQVHQPLLASPRVKEFYSFHEVIHA